MACLCRAPVGSTSRRLFSIAMALRDQHGSAGKSYAQDTGAADPRNLLESSNQVQLLFDDLPTRAFREFDLDGERLHYRRLMEWQLPQLGAKYGQKRSWRPDPSHKLVSIKREWAFEPDHDQASTAVIQVPISACLSRLESQSAQHKFKLLLGKRYRMKEGVVRIRGDRFPAYAQNLKWCSDQLDETLAEALIEPEKFDELPLSTSGQPKPHLSAEDIPKSWSQRGIEQRRRKAREMAWQKYVDRKAAVDPDWGAAGPTLPSSARGGSVPSAPAVAQGSSRSPQVAQA